MKNKLNLILVLALVWAFFPGTSARAEAVFVSRTGSANPFNSINLGLYSYASPAFADLDYDGDLDAFIGVYDGIIRYFENTGNRYSPVFSEVTGSGNPFNLVDVGTNSAPIFVDIDRDGDLDAFIGEALGTIKYFKNIGTIVSPNFEEKTSDDNPFNGEDVGDYSKPYFFDLNHDGDMDAFVGNDDGEIFWFFNNENATTPDFVAVIQPLEDSDGSTIDVGSFSAPVFMDLDGDGDMDLASGNGMGAIKYYENTSSAEDLPDLEEQLAWAGNPFGNVSVWSYSSPALVDIDGDGDLDAFIGEYLSGIISYYENVGDNTEAPYMQEQTYGYNPLYMRDVGANSAPVFVDIDADGDMDAFSGATDGTIYYYKNTGHATNPTLSSQTGTANPFDGVDVGAVSHLGFIDANGDGDFDAYIGDSNGKIYYFENMGDAVGPNFIERTGSLNPFNSYNGSEEESRSAPAFANYSDAYKGLEAIIGFSDGGFRSFVNTLFPFPSFTGDPSTPLTSIDVGDYSSPAFCDLHSDGKVDTFIGEMMGTIVYYTEFGSASGYNPFNGVDVGHNATPAFVDIDADGDYDAFIGELDGVFTFFENYSQNFKLNLPVVVR